MSALRAADGACARSGRSRLSTAPCSAIAGDYRGAQIARQKCHGGLAEPPEWSKVASSGRMCDWSRAGLMRDWMPSVNGKLGPSGPLREEGTDASFGPRRPRAASRGRRSVPRRAAGMAQRPPGPSDGPGTRARAARGLPHPRAALGDTRAGESGRFAPKLVPESATRARQRASSRRRCGATRGGVTSTDRRGVTRFKMPRRRPCDVRGFRWAPQRARRVRPVALAPQGRSR